MSKLKGDIAEQKALAFLKNNGFAIVETNFYAKKLGEIDIIAIKNNVYHFCEVKSAQDYETAILNITNTKLTKIKKSLNYYLKIKKLDVAYCIDAIIVVKDKIDYLENISL